VSEPERVTAVGLAASPGPRDLVPGARDELDAEDLAVLSLLAVDRPAGVAELRKNCAWYAGDGWETMFKESWGEADDPLLTQPDVLEPVKVWLREGARQGSAGFETDLLAALKPWGFSLADVGQPVHVWCAASDVQVSQAHADYLAESVPRATLVTFPDAGHLFPILVLARDARRVALTGRGAGLALVLEGDLELDAVLRDLSVGDLGGRLHDLDRLDVSHGARRGGDGLARRVAP
jgi:hypothetical protein